MRFVIINTDYPAFLEHLYWQHPGLAQRSYADQMQVRMASLFGVADFYSYNLRQLGHEVWELHPNNNRLQAAWAQEHNLPLARRPRRLAPAWLAAARTAAALGRRLPKRIGRFINRRLGDPAAFRIDEDLLAAQVRHYRPDVLLNHAILEIGGTFLGRVRSEVGHIIGQHAATSLPADLDLSCYELMLSSFPATISELARRGLSARPFQLGFEPRVLEHLSSGPPQYEVSFVGSFQAIHASRTAWMERLCEQLPQIRIWAPSLEGLAAHSPIRRHYVGPAWGLRMYQILRQSRITLNHHGNVPHYANNMRLYEATGVGSLLITDQRENLREMFEPGQEVISFSSTTECRDQIVYYLEHEQERALVARRGQTRTLQTHTYLQRMQELVGIVQRL
ncbi:MAG: glycosyltransferase family 1 protein [Anaerolineales bacterium]|nr:glycosyltransferase family 1 protein [Anaerolineales bacterium]